MCLRCVWLWLLGEGGMCSLCCAVFVVQFLMARVAVVAAAGLVGCKAALLQLNRLHAPHDLPFAGIQCAAFLCATPPNCRRWCATTSRAPLSLTARPSARSCCRCAGFGLESSQGLLPCGVFQRLKCSVPSSTVHPPPNPFNWQDFFLRLVGSYRKYVRRDDEITPAALALGIDRPAAGAAAALPPAGGSAGGSRASSSNGREERAAEDENPR